MKRYLSATLLTLVIAFSFVGIVSAADVLNNPQTGRNCVDKKGHFTPSKECGDGTQCTCLFHTVVTFVKGMFE